MIVSIEVVLPLVVFIYTFTGFYTGILLREGGGDVTTFQSHT